MALFAISYRVGMEGNSEERRASLLERAKSNASGGVWDETTSFLLITYAGSAASLAADIFLNSRMSSAHDQLLVVNLSAKEYAVHGRLTHTSTLVSLMSGR